MRRTIPAASRLAKDGATPTREPLSGSYGAVRAVKGTGGSRSAANPCPDFRPGLRRSLGRRVDRRPPARRRVGVDRDAHAGQARRALSQTPVCESPADGRFPKG